MQTLRRSAKALFVPSLPLGIRTLYNCHSQSTLAFRSLCVSCEQPSFGGCNSKAGADRDKRCWGGRLGGTNVSASGTFPTSMSFHEFGKLNTRLSQVPGSSSRLSSLALASQTKTCTHRDSVFPTRTREFVHLIQHYSQCYSELSKARLSMLVVATTGAGFVMGSGASIDWGGLASTCLGTMLVAAAANTINQILEVDSDSRMKRTLRRPLPAGRIGSQHALAWALTTGIGGVTLLASEANLIAAALGATNLVLYTLVYTPLKQVHPINTWVGAVVGAIPPILGWAAAAGEVGSGAWVLASALYFWQIPHFMAIAYLCRQDYAAGGFKMFSSTDSSGQKTALVALRNCGYLLPLGFLAYQMGVTSEWFGVETAMLSTGMAAMAAVFYYNPSAETARKLFRATLLYLPLLMLAIIFHRCPNQQPDSSPIKEADYESLETSGGDWTIIGSEEVGDRKSKRQISAKVPSRPPVAYMSAAPFPFLPTPKYGHD